jgi:hypothetical protein
MFDEPRDVKDVLLRILAQLGGDCGPNVPQAASDNNAGAARNFMRRTAFDGTRIPDTPQVASGVNAEAEVAPGYALFYASAWNISVQPPDIPPPGNRVQNVPVRVYFDRPAQNTPWVLLYPGQWVRRGRGWQQVWVTLDQDLEAEFYPVLVVSTDPSFTIEGDTNCCAGEEVLPITLSASDDTSQVVAAVVPTAVSGIALTIPAGQGGDWHVSFNGYLAGAAGDGHVNFGSSIRVNGAIYDADTARVGIGDLVAGGTPPNLGFDSQRTLFGLSAGDIVEIWMNPVTIAAPADTGGISIEGRNAFAIKVG